MITTEEAERLAMILNRLDMDRNATALRSLAAERDALKAEVERLKAGGCARDQSTTQFCAEAVALQAENARLRKALEGIEEYWNATALRSLAAERDALKMLFVPITVECEKVLKLGTMAALLSCPDDMTKTQSGAHRLAHLVVQWSSEKARAEKAEAENARLREALKECADDLEAEITHRYGGMVTKYPTQRLKRDQDMAPVMKARAALGEKE
jgi:hypothetical protein